MPGLPHKPAQKCFLFGVSVQGLCTGSHLSVSFLSFSLSLSLSLFLCRQPSLAQTPDRKLHTRFLKPSSLSSRVFALPTNEEQDPSSGTSNNRSCSYTPKDRFPSSLRTIKDNQLDTGISLAVNIAA